MRSDAEKAAWLADKVGALGDYAKEAAELLRRWPEPTIPAQERISIRREAFFEGMSAATHRNLIVLLRRGLAQIDAWQKAYGEHQPAWLPPAGDVRWMEDVQAVLDGAAGAGDQKP